jgi:hypothetical protein
MFISFTTEYRNVVIINKQKYVRGSQFAGGVGGWGMFWSMQLLVLKVGLGLIVIVLCHVYPLTVSVMKITFMTHYHSHLAHHLPAI